MTTQPLVEPASVSDLERSPAVISKHEKQLPNRLVLWGFIMMFIGVVVGITGKKLMHEEMVTVVGALVSVAGMFLTAYPFLLPSSRPKVDSSLTSPPEILIQSQPNKYLPQKSNIEYVPSVTERTTDLLRNSAATGPKQKENGESQA